MAHYAEIDENNKVVRVLVVPDEYENDGQTYLAETIGLGGTWIKTSYNGKIRNKYAGVGYLYDEDLDAFIIAKPYDSWLRDGLGWKAPKPQPAQNYLWNEETQEWYESTEEVTQ